MIYLIATLRITPGSLPAVIAAVKPCLDATRQEAGCISYDLHVDVTDPEALVFVERWETREALAAHFTTPHLQAWRAAGGPHILARRIEIIDPETVETL
ncbi:MAG: putative quinol monooxygenase [Hyphomicrobiales bacterium]|nr:putative quinol monooxygenase [Hyphomicrobiales bacterium]